MQFISLHSSSSANLYRVDSENESILIEAGLTVSKIREKLNFKLSVISGALISHSHGDHAKGVAGLIRAGVDCYLTAETAEALGVSGHRVHIIEPLKQFKIVRFDILPFPTQHDCPGACGFLVSDKTDKLVFATDTFYLRYRFQGITIIAVECNYSRETIAPDICPTVRARLYKSHFSLENVINFLGSNDISRVREIHLLHLSDGNSDAEMFIRKIQQTSGIPVYVAGE